MTRPARLLGGACLSAVNFALALPVGYLASLTVIAWIVRDRSHVRTGSHEPITRFAVIIPAHNEAATMPTMLASLASLDYPASLVTVHLIADNCADATASLAAAAGVEVHERFDPRNPGKGPALNWLMDRLVDRGDRFDAAVFVDADTSVSPHFLDALDRRFRAGAVAVQGHYGVRDAFTSTSTTLRYCALAGRHHLRPLARTALGGSCGLFGNGMALERELAINRRWTDHLVEDMEFQVELFLEGVHVDYEPNALIEAEMPDTLTSSASQHQRWELGRLDIARRYVPKLGRLITRDTTRRRLAACDMVADLVTPPLSLVAMATASSAVAGSAAACFAPSRTTRLNAVISVTLMTLLVLHVTTALRLIDAPREAYRALLHAPRLAAWKAGLLIRSLGRTGSADWTRTRRNDENAG